MPPHPSFRKSAPADRAGAERAVLRLVDGAGIVPIRASSDPTTVVTPAGAGTVADLLVEQGTLAEPACRAIGVRVARALHRVHAHDHAHGDVKPANLVFNPDGDLWLIDFDAAGRFGSPRMRGTPQRLLDPHTISRDDDIVALALTLIECATGVLVDPKVTWTEATLAELGCSTVLAADLASVLRHLPSAHRVAELLQRSDDLLPVPPGRSGCSDPTPTVDLPGTAIVGLAPIGDAAAPADESQRSRRVRSSKVSRRTTRRASPSATNTTGARGTLL